MISVVALLALMVAIIAPAKAAMSFLGTRQIRVYQLRSVFERVGIQLTPNQRISHTDDRLADFKSLVYSDTDCITAFEFLDDRRRNRRLMQRLDDVSPSLFMEGVGTRLSFALVSALVLVPLFLGIAALLPPLSSLLPLLVANDQIGMMILVAGAGFAGILCSILACLLVWRINFKKDIAQVLLIAAEQPLWNIGPERNPVGRSFIEPAKDPHYSALKG